MDKMERERKREARKAHKISEFAQKSFGLRAKMFNQKRFKEKAAMRKTIAMHQEGSNKHANDDKNNDGTLPAYLLDRDEVSRAKILSNTVKQKRKEKAGKWTVPIPKVCPSAWKCLLVLFPSSTSLTPRLVCTPHRPGQAHRRRRDVQADEVGETHEEELEAHDHQGAAVFRVGGNMRDGG